MKFASKAAMAAALAISMSTSAFVAPAFAKKKDEKAENGQPPLKVGKEFRETAVKAQKALQANDNATAKPLVAQLQSEAKTDDEKYFAAQLALPLASREKDYAAMKPALQTLIASPRVSQADKGKYNFVLAQLAMQDKDSASALNYLKQAKALGYSDPEMPLMMVRLQSDSGDTAGALASLNEAISADTAAGKKAPENLYRYGVQLAYDKKMDGPTMDWLEKWMSAYPSNEGWRKTIMIYFQMHPPATTQDGKKVKLDLMRLMQKTGALANQSDYVEYAQTANDLGLPYEAKSVIDAGKADGKITSSSAAVKDIYQTATAGVRSDTPLATLKSKAESSSSGVAASQAGDVFLSHDDYQTAASMYQTALQKGGVDANAVNLNMGIALAQAGQYDAAKTALQAVQGAPRADVAGLWTAWVNGKQTGATAAPAAPAATPATTGS